MYYLLGALAAVVIFAFTRGNSVRKSRAYETKSISEHLHEELLVLDRIAISAAFESQGSVLDHADESVSVIEDILIRSRSVQPENASRLVLTLGSHLGETLVRNHAGVWRMEQSDHPLPFLVFPNKVRASSFDLIQSQLNSEVRILRLGYSRLIRLIHEESGETLRAPSVDGVEISETMKERDVE